MNDLLLYFTTNYGNSPILSVTGLIILVWYSSTSISQLFNWSLAWIDDAKEIKINPIHKLIGLTGKDAIVHDDGFPAGFLLYLLVFPFIATLISVCIHYWFITMWFLLFGVVMHSLRGGRRVQKKLTKHINDKEAHK